MARYNRADIIALIKKEKVEGYIQIMGESALVVQGIQRTCREVELLPRDILSFPPKPVWDRRKRAYMLGDINFGNLRPRREITTMSNGYHCQIVGSVDSDKRINK